LGYDMFDGTQLRQYLARHAAIIDAAATQFPEGSHLRAALLRLRDLCTQQRALLDALETVTPANAAQLGTDLLQCNAEVLKGFADVAALLQEAGEDYDRELLQRALDFQLPQGP